RGVTRRMGDAGWAFLRRAGTVILAAMIIIWALLYFPYGDANGMPYEQRIEEATAKAEQLKADPQAAPSDVGAAAAGPGRLKAEWTRNSFMGRVGRALEPAFEPLGWDWRIGMAAIASFPAREVIVGMLGMVYEVDEEEGDEHTGLQDAVRKEWANDPVRGPYRV